MELVESDDEQIFQDAVPHLPPLTNGCHTTLVQIHRIPSSMASIMVQISGFMCDNKKKKPRKTKIQFFWGGFVGDHEDVETANTSPEQQEETVPTEEPADLVTF